MSAQDKSARDTENENICYKTYADLGIYMIVKIYGTSKSKRTPTNGKPQQPNIRTPADAVAPSVRACPDTFQRLCHLRSDSGR
jgi:hypothetical protein